MKKRVAFLFTGESRCNPMGFCQNPRHDILDSYNRNIFNYEFTTKFDYDIYISTDDVNLHTTIEYFGPDKIKNIHIIKSFYGHPEYYLEEVPSKLKPENCYVYDYEQQNFHDCISYPNSIRQNYKICDAYNMLQQKNIHYDFIVKIRFDNTVLTNIMECFKKFEDNAELQIIGQTDMFFIGKPDIMKFYCRSIDRNYGKYNFNLTNHVFNSNIIDYKTYQEWKTHEYQRWTYAYEVQVWETLFEYCALNNLDLDKSIQYMYMVGYISHHPGAY